VNEINGKWWYQSFCPLAAIVDRTQSPPKVQLSAQIAGPWTPSTIMEFKTEADKIAGSAKLGSYTFKINGSLTPVIDSTGFKIPKGFELTIVVDGIPTEYKLRGFFLINTKHLVGTVVAIRNDLGGQPDGTSGPFLLFPAES
jgi:hypothetical protein